MKGDGILDATTNGIIGWGEWLCGPKTPQSRVLGGEVRCVVFLPLPFCALHLEFVSDKDVFMMYRALSHKCV